ncbi:ppg3 protein [Cryptosporidium ryanae]|uniref:ppg3 protein n=1 Tax=Cryptosporidium ryanae TaxID=515981 RepID=UPI00351A43C4|nr:ppg3 protein [Cryptosporidium ryanae]
MYRIVDPKNEISSYEWENDLGKLICGNLVYLNELVKNLSDDYLDLKLSLVNKENEDDFKLFESFYEPLIYYMYKNKINPLVERCKNDKDATFCDFGNNVTGGVRGRQSERIDSRKNKGNRLGEDGSLEEYIGDENKRLGVNLKKEFNDLGEDDSGDELDEDRKKYVFFHQLFMKSGNKKSVDLFRFGKTPDVNINDLFDFVLSLLYVGGFSISSFVMAIINMDNLVKKTNLLVCQHNWRPIFVISLIISDKLWDDNCVKSGDLSKIVGFISPRMIKYLEFVFSVSSGWSFEFNLENIKNHISKILKKDLSKKLMDKVINSGFYQSYCYEDLCELNTKTETFDIKKELENEKSEISTPLDGDFNAGPTLRSNTSTNLMSNCLKKEFVVNTGIGTYGHTQAQRRTPFNIQNINSFGTTLNQNNNINSILLRGGDNRMIQTLLPSRSLSFHRNNSLHPRIGDPISTNTNSGMNVYNLNSMINIGGSNLNPLNKRHFFSPLNNNNNKVASHTSNVSIHNFMRNPSPNPQLSSNQNVSNVIGPNNKLQNSNLKLSSKNMLFDNNIVVGIHPRSITPDNHITRKDEDKQKTKSPILSPQSIERGRDERTTKMNSNPHSLLERKVSCSKSQQQGRSEFNGKGVLGGGFLSSRSANLIKRSSSENRGFVSNKVDIGSAFQPAVKRDGLFSYARNTVSSALTSITRTLGISSSAELDVNSTQNVGNFSNYTDIKQDNNKRVVQKQNSQVRNVSVPPQISDNNIGEPTMNPIQTNRTASNNMMNFGGIHFNARNETKNNFLPQRALSTERTSYLKTNQVAFNPITNLQNISSLSNNTVRPAKSSDKSIFSNIWGTVTGKNNSANTESNGGQVRSFSIQRSGGGSLQGPHQQLGLTTNNIPFRFGFPLFEQKNQMLNSSRARISDNNGLVDSRHGNIGHYRDSGKTIQRSSSRSAENRPSLTLNGERDSSLFSMNKIINPISNLLKSRDSSLQPGITGRSIARENRNGFSINSLMSSRFLR